jgi:hypothetical protein
MLVRPNPLFCINIYVAFVIYNRIKYVGAPNPICTTYMLNLLVTYMQFNKVIYIFRKFNYCRFKIAISILIILVN